MVYVSEKKHSSKRSGIKMIFARYKGKEPEFADYE